MYPQPRFSRVSLSMTTTSGCVQRCVLYPSSSLTLSSNSSHVLASCAACAQRVHYHVLSLPLPSSLPHAFALLRLMFSQHGSISSHFTLIFPLPFSARLDLYTLPQSYRAPRECQFASYSLFLSPPRLRQSSPLSSFFSFMTSLDLPVRVLFDRQTLHAGVLHQPEALYTHMAFSCACT